MVTRGFQGSAMVFRNDPQSRVVPDTNTWLDAAFWPDSVARRALATLQASGRPIIIEELIENEALRILARRRIELGLSFDPAEHFKSFTAGFLHVPASDLVQVKVNKADMPVARAAVHYKATILTQDAPLAAECLADNISAQFPWNVMVANDAASPAEEILRIVRPAKHIGTIFARVTPGGWLGKNDVGEFTVADVEHIGRLWFDSRSEEWVIDGVQSTRMKFSAAGKGQSLICATYDLPSSGNGKIILRAFSPQSGDRDTRTVVTLKLKNDGGQVRVGSSFAGQAYWNGCVWHLTVSPEGMSSAKWKPICDIPDAAPNPLNAAALNRGLLAMDGR
jgi:predicted nucleic acid-binding protein